MPLFLVERSFAEQFENSAEDRSRVLAYEEIHDITWLTSFLSADRKKTYCLYEVDDVELLRKHAADLGLPVDVIVEINELPH